MSTEQPPPWEGYGREGYSDCWIHHRSEKRRRRTYRVCFECGHVYTRFSLWRAWVRTGREMRHWRTWTPIVASYAPPDGLPQPDAPTMDLLETTWGPDGPVVRPGRFREWWHCWIRRPSKIDFCQECIHDW